MKTGTQGCEIGEGGYVAEKREKVTINRSKKVITSNETAQTSAIFLSQYAKTCQSKIPFFLDFESV